MNEAQLKIERIIALAQTIADLSDYMAHTTPTAFRGELKWRAEMIADLAQQLLRAQK